MGWVHRAGRLSVAAVVMGAATGCSSGGFNDSAFSPNGGQLTGLYQGHLACLGLMPGRFKQVYPVELTQGYAVRTNPVRIVDPDGHEVATVGEVVSVDTLGEAKRKRGCGKGRNLIMLEGSTIKVLSITPTASK